MRSHFLWLFLLFVLISFSGCTSSLKIALTGEENKALKAVDKIEDQSELKRIAVESSNNNVKLKALHKIYDEEYIRHGIKNLIWSYSVYDTIIYHEMLDKIDDPEYNLDLVNYIIKEISHENSGRGIWILKSMVRYILNQVEDQATLSALVLEYPDKQIKEMAFEKLNDPKHLYEVFMKARGYFEFQVYAKLTDSTYYAAIDSILYNRYENTRIRFSDDYGFQYINHIRNSKILIEIFKTANEKTRIGQKIKESALKRITDQAFLAELIMSDSYYKKIALANLTDENTLIKLVDHEINKKLQYYGNDFERWWFSDFTAQMIRKINSQTYLKQLIINYKHPKIVCVALSQLYDVNQYVYQLYKQGYFKTNKYGIDIFDSYYGGLTALLTDQKIIKSLLKDDTLNWGFL